MSKSQTLRVLSHLKRAPLTARQASHLYDCDRLAARIYDLRCAGHMIDTQTVEKGGKSFAKYRLFDSAGSI